MKKLIVFLSIILVLFLIGYIGGNYILEQAAIKFTEELRPKLEDKGVIIEKLDYGDISINSLRSIKVKNVALVFKLKKEEFGSKSYAASFTASSVILKLASIREVSGTFAIHDFSIFVEPDDSRLEKPFGKIDNAMFKCGIPISLKHPEKDAIAILHEIEKLFNENHAQLLELTGDVHLGMEGKEATIKLITLQHKDSVSLQFNKDDIMTVSNQNELELTIQEAEVIANHPGKVPTMLRITREAKYKSQQERRMDNTFPEDAFRHIYWSYHLTRAMGPDFAKQVTDAHETAPGNTQKERLMDYHNNEVGRNLAAKSYSDEELKTMVLSSNSIIRNPNSVRISQKSQ